MTRTFCILISSFYWLPKFACPALKVGCANTAKFATIATFPIIPGITLISRFCRAQDFATVLLLMLSRALRPPKFEAACRSDQPDNLLNLFPYLIPRASILTTIWKNHRLSAQDELTAPRCGRGMILLQQAHQGRMTMIET